MLISPPYLTSFVSCGVGIGRLGDDRVRVSGPGEGAPAAVVSGGDETLDRADEVGDDGQVAATQRLPGGDREEGLDQVQPGPRGESEVQGHLGMAFEPGARRRMRGRGQ